MTIRGFAQVEGFLLASFAVMAFAVRVDWMGYVLLGVAAFCGFIVPIILDEICASRGHLTPDPREPCFRCGEVMR